MIRRIVIISGQVSVLILSLFLVPGVFADGDCSNPIARLVSVQGDAQFRQADQANWSPVNWTNLFVPVMY